MDRSAKLFAEVVGVYNQDDGGEDPAENGGHRVVLPAHTYHVDWADEVGILLHGAVSRLGSGDGRI